MGGKERLIGLTQADLKGKGLRRIEPTGEYASRIADELKGVIFGQDAACERISPIILRAEHALNDVGKPLGSVLLLGPTGVGKTEMARAISKYFFQHDPEKAKDRILFIDCSEFQQEHDVKKLTGSPNSYVGYGDKLKLDPEWLMSYDRSIIVFDEVEKAHPSFHQLLLGILGDGRLTATTTMNTPGGRGTMPIEMDFSNTFFVLTSNIGAASIQDVVQDRQIGFHPPAIETADKHKLIEKAALYELGRVFRHKPELLGRVDEIIVFEPLEDEAVYEKIVDKFTDEFNCANDEIWVDKIKVKKNEQGEITETKKFRELKRPRIAPYLALTKEAKLLLVAARDKRYGARDIKREFQKLTAQIAGLIGDRLVDEEKFVIAGVEDGQLAFYTD